MADPASDILDPIAEALATALKGVGFDSVHKWAPRAADLSAPVAAVIEMPTVTRPELERPENELGSMTWRLSYPVMAYFPMDDLAYGQAKAVAFAEASIRAVEADQTLGDPLPPGVGRVDEVRVTNAGPPVIFEDENPPSIRYPLTVAVLAYVM